MAKEFGWAYVAGTQASGPKGSVQLAGITTALEHDPNLLWSDEENALMVSGNIIAHNFEIQNQTKTVFHFEVSGSSIFGDTEDDLHQFTGSLDITGNVSASTFYGWGGDLDGVAINEYNNFGDNRLVTSIGEKSVNAEANLLFDGTLLSVTGNVQALEVKADEVSGTLGFFEDVAMETLSANEITSSALTSNTAVIPNTTLGDVILTGRIVDVNGNVILGTPTAQTEFNISSNSNGQTQIASNNFSNVNSTNAVGMDFAVINEGLAVATNRFFVGSAGKSGFGTNDPEKKVEIYDPTGTQLRLSSVGADQIVNGGVLFNPTRHHTDLTTDSTGAFSIMPTAQKLGINTTSPEHALDVSGDARITGNLIVSGTLTAHTTDFVVSADTLTFGDEASDTIIMNASTISTPNGLVIDNSFYMQSGTVGVGNYATSKFGVSATSNQFSVGDGTKTLSINVENSSTTLSTNSTTLDIANSTNVLGELVVGSNGDIVLNNIGEVSSSVSVSSHLGHFTNITSNTITNGNTTVNSDNIVTPTLDATTVNSTNLGGTLSTAAQPNVTSLGTLTSLNVANAASIGGGLNVGSSIAVGTNSASRKVEIKDSNPQMRLTNTDAVFGLSSHTYADLHVQPTGDLSLLPSSGKVIIPQLNLSNIPEGSSFKHLSLDENGNVVISPNLQHGIEVRSRVVATQDYQVQTSDYFVGIQSQQNLVVTLPDASSLINGQIFIITDELANAQVHNLVIQASNNQTIDGLSQLTLASPRSSISIYTDGQSNFFLF
jgi:hypothetical protein